MGGNMAKPLAAISSIDELLEYVEERHDAAGIKVASLTIAARTPGIMIESRRELAGKEAECNVLGDIKMALKRIMQKEAKDETQ
jgi:isocitrate/isopropylmalate dehydrogenase